MLRHILPFLPVLLPGAAAGADTPVFNRDIRPILSDKCFACHGSDSQTREAGLRLDTPEGATAKNEEGHRAIVPGDPGASTMWARINTADQDDVMPPPESHKVLSAEEKETIKRWIEGGAPYQKHWAFEPPVPPAGAAADIDAALDAAMKVHGLAASGDAPREMLLRRVSFALTGLPPSPDEQKQYFADAAPDAYERMVDRYLASPHYGEEMARHWLDVARYADTHGLHLDNERQMWPYRDWVVRSFNTNKPFDQFTVEQLAGDLLPAATQDQIIGTGFNRCNVTTGEGGSIDAEFVFRYAVERASTTAQTWLGLTAGCAVCHDHKYDPITARDFYSLYAFFHSSADPAMDGNALLTAPVAKVKPEGYDEKIKAFDARLAGVRDRMNTRVAGLSYLDPADAGAAPVMEEAVWFEDAFTEGAAVGASGHPTMLVSAPAPVFSGTKSLKRGGREVAQDYYESGAAPLNVPQEPQFFLHVYLDPSDPPEEIMIQFHSGQWRHRALWGADVIEFGTRGTTERYLAGPLPESGKWVRLEVDAGKTGIAPGTKISGYAFTVQGGTAYFDKMGVRGRIDPASDPAHSFAAWRKAQAGRDTPGASGELRQWLKEGPDKPRSDAELEKLRHYYLQRVCTATSGVFAAERAELDAVIKERADFESMVPSTFVWKDMDTPRESFVMLRGAYDKPGEKVVPDTPHFLPPLKKAAPRATRLDLAQWIISPENPLTARVTVNRFWQQIFGTGLVKTSHDFGTQSDLPSHPELLDALAVGFQRNRWDVKALIRGMLVSRAFRRDSAAPAEAWSTDPENRFLARGPRFRLDAEQLRDQALFCGGLLSMEAGGKGVKPYQPPNIWEPVGFAGSNTRFYQQDKGSALYRRSLYTFLKRTAPAPFMINFDAPSRESSCTRRERSNTPLQALQLMNDVQHFEAARGLAARLIAAGGTAQKRIEEACRIVLARVPSPAETAVMLEFYGRQEAKFKADPAAAAKAVRFGESPPPAGLDEAELAAWTLLANLVLNLDEAITRN